MAINLGRAIARGIAGTTQPYADRINAEKDAEVARRIKMADIPVVAAEAKAIAKAEHPFLMAQKRAGRALPKPADSFNISPNAFLSNLFGDKENPFTTGLTVPFSGADAARREDQLRDLTESTWGQLGRQIRAESTVNNVFDPEKHKNLLKRTIDNIKKTGDWDQLTSYVNNVLTKKLTDTKGSLPPLTSLFNRDMLTIVNPIINNYLQDIQNPAGKKLINYGLPANTVGNLFANITPNLEDSPYFDATARAMSPKSPVRNIVTSLNKGEYDDVSVLISDLRTAMPTVDASVPDEDVLQIFVDSASYLNKNSRHQNGQPVYVSYPKSKYQDVSGIKKYEGAVELVQQVDAVALTYAQSGENRTLPFQSDVALNIMSPILNLVSGAKEVANRFLGRGVQITSSSANDAFNLLESTLLEGENVDQETVDSILLDSRNELTRINQALQSTNEQQKTAAEIELRAHQAKTVLMFSIAKFIQGGGGGNAVSNADFLAITKSFNLAVSGDPQERAEAFLSGLRHIRNLAQNTVNDRNRSLRYMHTRQTGGPINFGNISVINRVTLLANKKRNEKSNLDFWNDAFRGTGTTFNMFFGSSSGTTSSERMSVEEARAQASRLGLGVDSGGGSSSLLPRVGGTN